MISSGKGVRCPSDGRKPERVAFLLCVGSRDRQIGREWCSKICCTVSCNIAMEIREELPNCHVYIYYMDIRTYGLYETKYYWASQEVHKPPPIDGSTLMRIGRLSDQAPLLRWMAFVSRQRRDQEKPPKRGT